MPSVIDMFCGVGGLTHGFLSEGFDVIAGVDIDETVKFAYEHNNPGARFVQANIEVLDPQDVMEWFPNNSIRILVGCAPCQPFSSHTNKVRDKNENWQLVSKFADLVWFKGI